MIVGVDRQVLVLIALIGLMALLATLMWWDARQTR